MRRTGTLAAAVIACLLLGACASGSSGGGGPSSAPPSGASSTLAVQIRYTGGLPGPAFWAPRIPLVSVYADGRVITEGPTPAISPGPALPNLLVQHISPAEVRTLTEHAEAAGVGESGDLGRPAVADALTTVFTAVTSSGPHVRQVYALGTSSGVTGDQAAARDKLKKFFDELTALGRGAGADEPYRADAVAVLAHPWSDSSGALPQPEKAWPGPALPGQAVPDHPGETCVTAMGAAGRAVLDAAGSANEQTPWTTADGGRWALRFRPLLPGESGCADLTG